ncbi:hypothetical protein PS15m_012282 [Mucor circinelloides]
MSCCCSCIRPFSLVLASLRYWLSPASRLSGVDIISLNARLSGARSVSLSGFVFKVVSPLFEALSFSGLVSVPLSLYLVLLLRCSRCSGNINTTTRAVYLVCAIRTSSSTTLLSNGSMQCGQVRDGFHDFGYNKKDF